MKRADSGSGPGGGATTAGLARAKKAARPARTAAAGDGRARKPKATAPAPGTKKAQAPGRDGSPWEIDQIDPRDFRDRLMAWYRTQARDLPWRDSNDPYRIWVSEIMLQQTRVAAVIEHYNEFLRRFPTLLALSLAAEADVLAAWSGLGYYRRARMLHKAAQFIVLEREGRLPASSVELRTLPGIGEYTAAAIASIAFGEAVAVVDGNVERVILRLTGQPNEATAAARAFVRGQAQALMPKALAPASIAEAEFVRDQRPKPRGAGGWDAAERIALAATADPTAPAGGEAARPHVVDNTAGEHNQAMMELGATVCLPRAPLCLRCPVHALCRTRGEHATPPRAPQRSLPVACLLELRKRGTATEVLLEHRAAKAAVMPAMFELPPLPLEAVEGREPVLRVRHAITNTNYYVQVYAARRNEPRGPSGEAQPGGQSLRRAIAKDGRDLHWVPVTRLAGIPITGLTRKILQRLHVMENPRISLLER